MCAAVIFRLAGCRCTISSAAERWRRGCAFCLWRSARSAGTSVRGRTSRLLAAEHGPAVRRPDVLTLVASSSAHILAGFATGLGHCQSTNLVLARPCPAVLTHQFAVLLRPCLHCRRGFPVWSAARGLSASVWAAAGATPLELPASSDARPATRVMPRSRSSLLPVRLGCSWTHRCRRFLCSVVQALVNPVCPATITTDRQWDQLLGFDQAMC